MNVQCVSGGLQTMLLRVLHLDDTIHTFNLSVHAVGRELFASMVDRINLLESDYFDLEFMNEEGFHCWLDHEKPILRQIHPGKDFLFRFVVKFYTPFPNLLEEDLARYLFALQIKRDLVTGTLLCSENTAALLASFVVQAELGDFIEEEYQSIDYLRPLRLLHQPTAERLHRVMCFHRAHIGLSPAEADIALLDTARKAEFYGIRLHFVRNMEGLGFNVAVSHQGILVFKNLVRVSTFAWAAVRKLSFKRKHFLVKLLPERDACIEFIFDSRDECKQFWKNCIEHHTFFRCPTLDTSGPGNKRARSRSSSAFRYTGRTEQELSQYVQQHSESVIPFKRPSSARRAYSTILSGSNFPRQKFSSAISMQLRSKSADRRQQLTTTLTKPIPPIRKRAQSDSPKAVSVEINQMDLSEEEKTNQREDAPPTSGYATMVESAGSGPSSCPNTTAEHDSGEEKQADLDDTLNWISETYKRMTEQTSLAGEKPTTEDRSQQTCDTPMEDGVFSLGQLNADLEGFLKQSDQGFSNPLADQLATHLLVFGDLTQTTGLASTDSTRPPETLPRTVKSTQNMLSDLTRNVFLSDPNMGSWIGWMASPTHEPATFEERQALSEVQVQTSSLQPQTGRETTGKSSPAIVDWIAGLSEPTGFDGLLQSAKSESTVKPDTSTTGPNEPRPLTVGMTSLSRSDAAITALPTGTGLFDEFGLPKTLFLLPSVTQYGMSLNVSESEIKYDPQLTYSETISHTPMETTGVKEVSTQESNTITTTVVPDPSVTAEAKDATGDKQRFTSEFDSSIPHTHVPHPPKDINSTKKHRKPSTNGEQFSGRPDRWSSSSSDSTNHTGVIHPNGLESNTKRQPLPNLPLDTLPTRSTKRGNPREAAHTQSLSRSTPLGVNLSGMEERQAVYQRKPRNPSRKTDNTRKSKKDNTQPGSGPVIEEAPYMVLHRPRASVDVKQYQQHLQRQQQQAAALAAAGYPFHHIHPYYAESSAYQFGTRPYIPAHRHVPTAYRSSRQYPAEFDPSTGHYRSTKHQVYSDQVPDYMFQSVEAEKEQRNALRSREMKARHSMPRFKDPIHQLRYPEQAILAAHDPRLGHHVQCSHREMPPYTADPSEVIAHRSIARAKRNLKPKSTEGAPSGKQADPERRARRRQRMPATHEMEDHEFEVPYPVSELYHVTTRNEGQFTVPRHQHHPACSSLLGRGRSRPERPGVSCAVHKSHQTMVPGRTIIPQSRLATRDEHLKQSKRDTLKEIEHDLRTAGFHIIPPGGHISTVEGQSWKAVNQKHSTEDAKRTSRTKQESSKPDVAEVARSHPSLSYKTDLFYGGVPENPIYLESESDSGNHLDKKSIKSREQRRTVETVDAATSPIEPPPPESVTSGFDKLDLSPISYRSSLPCSNVPSDGGETSLRSPDQSVPGPIGSMEAPLICPRCDWYEAFDRSVTPYPCIARRHHSACRCRQWHDSHTCCDRRHSSPPCYHHRPHSLHHRDHFPQETGHRHSKCFEPSSTSATSASEEFSDVAELDLDDLEDGEQRIKLQIILNKLLAHERKLRAELALHRKLTSQLKHAKCKMNRTSENVMERVEQLLTEEGKMQKAGKSEISSNRKERRKHKIPSHHRAPCHHVSAEPKMHIRSRRSDGRKHSHSADTKSHEEDALIIVNETAMDGTDSGHIQPSTSHALIEKRDGDHAGEVLTTCQATNEVTINDASAEPLEKTEHGSEVTHAAIDPEELPPSPPKEPPPRLFYEFSDEKGTKQEREVRKTPEETGSQSTEQHSASLPHPSQGTIHESDSDDDGTKAMRLLNSVIDDALQTDAERYGDENAQTNEDSHTSETSVDTVKAAYSPRAATSPSSSTSSESEGSEEIEPFPPPPPPMDVIENLHLVGPTGTLTQVAVNTFPTSLEEVIEEEGFVTEQVEAKEDIEPEMDLLCRFEDGREQRYLEKVLEEDAEYDGDRGQETCVMMNELNEDVSTEQRERQTENQNEMDGSEKQSAEAVEDKAPSESLDLQGSAEAVGDKVPSESLHLKVQSSHYSIGELKQAVEVEDISDYLEHFQGENSDVAVHEIIAPAEYAVIITQTTEPIVVSRTIDNSVEVVQHVSDKCDPESSFKNESETDFEYELRMIVQRLINEAIDVGQSVVQLEVVQSDSTMNAHEE